MAHQVDAGHDWRPQFASLSRSRSAPPMVLLVDPDADGALRLAQALQGSVGTLTHVSSAEAAWEAIRRRVPDLLVTEVALPAASGIELLRNLHQNPLTRDVLIMVVTSRNAIRDKIAAFQAGADDYLVKPVDVDVFLLHILTLSRFRRTLRF